ncbi:hypothetical protein PFRI_36550 [Planktotalea frisia]|uniref:Uncharacterized protein n=1 Tax=Planktotalea frisia TaxID=696762 RepID=A0A1L9NRX3_9RHOB|nr:hypothetical protein PFRI_36550 [Planktotalea frisia]
MNGCVSEAAKRNFGRMFVDLHIKRERANPAFVIGQSGDRHVHILRTHRREECRIKVVNSRRITQFQR